MNTYVFLNEEKKNNKYITNLISVNQFKLFSFCISLVYSDCRSENDIYCMEVTLREVLQILKLHYFHGNHFT